MRLMKFVCAGFVGAALLVGATAAHAQDYPTREIRTICPFAPGTGADIVVRYYASKLAEIAGKPVITENRPGAQGLLGTEAVARAKPDGYTISINPVASTMAAAVHIFKTLSFDPLKDFEFGGTLLSTSFVLVVAPKDSIRTLADLTKYLKEKKGDAFYGGSTNTGIVASELYKNAIGVDVKRVNYRSAFDALNEMASGNIDFYFTDATTALGQIAAGRYRPLAVTGPKRTKALPDVPTMTEAGIPDGLRALVGNDHAGWHPQADRRQAHRLDGQGRGAARDQRVSDAQRPRPASRRCGDAAGHADPRHHALG